MKCSLYFMYETAKERGMQVKLHKHSSHEIVFYLSGSGTTKIGGQQYNFHSNTLAVIPPETWHDETHTADGRVLFIGFDYSDDDIVLTDHFYDITDNPEIQRHVSNLVKEMACQKPYYQKMVSHILASCIIELVRGKGGGAQCRDIFYIINYIKENYGQKINFRDMAGICGYSYDYFRFLFYTKTGVYPKKFLISQRLAASRELLLTTDKKILDIAYLCGFSSSAQFANMFRAAEHMSPREFRALHT